MRAPVQMRWGTRVFSRVSTADTGFRHPFILSDERQACIQATSGNPTLFLVRETRNPLNLRQKSQGPSHIPIAEGMLLLRCLWKVGLPVE